VARVFQNATAAEFEALIAQKDPATVNEAWLSSTHEDYAKALLLISAVSNYESCRDVLAPFFPERNLPDGLNRSPRQGYHCCNIHSCFPYFVPFAAETVLVLALLNSFGVEF
jgi:hypothetical protein